MVEGFGDDRLDPARMGFDVSVEFQPDWLQLGTLSQALPEGNSVYDYATIVKHMKRKPAPSNTSFPCVTPG